MRTASCLTLSLAGALAALLAFGELTHWRASRGWLGGDHNRGGREIVVVLGYRNPGERANFLNRYRVRAGIRSIDPLARESTLLLCGAAVAGPVSEAELMSDYAREELGFTGCIVLETASTSTQENVENAIVSLDGADTIKIVSNSIHAEKARFLLWESRPDLARRLVRGEDHRFGEITVVKPVAALLGLPDLRRTIDGSRRA
ncbi:MULTISPECIES: YdcF family protein [unclassified Brevibacterium]|uniref:YdcF family protein n=1 Tax=unclassified Brevibacterium TaxID=2614124 RepID=UPI001E507B2C|nr:MULTISPECIES: YdcF family protein [unclassified Brevibacterium]MDK8435188.1 YdcF family protein [Brevibacterium sp. H-BE7]